MKLKDFIVTEAILPEMKAKTAKEAIEEMVTSLVSTKALPNGQRKKVSEAILKREKKGTTGFGNGVAIPHAKHEGVKGVVGVVGRCPIGVDFAALDGQPVHLFFLLLSNPDQPEEHLKAMEHIFRSIKNDNLRRFMCQATSRDELAELLMEADEGLG